MRRADETGWQYLKRSWRMYRSAKRVYRTNMRLLAAAKELQKEGYTLAGAEIAAIVGRVAIAEYRATCTHVGGHHK